MNDQPSKSIPKSIIQALPAPGWPPIQEDLASAAFPADKLRRMNLNESPYPPSPKAVAAMQEACTRVNTYPDPRWRHLTAAISERLGVPQDRIVMGNGSDESIVHAGRIALNPGDEVVVPVPSFPGYMKCAALGGAKLVPVPVRQDGANDVDGMLAAVTEKTRLLFAATPNNPTGGLLSADDVKRLAEGVPDTCLLIVDEAYYEFGIHAGGEDHLATLAARPGPWAVFRTFSKAYGLAGIRVGYTIAGSDEIAEAFQKARSVFSVNVVGQAGALAAWEDRDHMTSILDRTAEQRERIVAGLKALGCRPFPTVGNFVTAETPRAAKDVVAGLLGHGIMIGSLMAPGFETYIRITVGTAEDTDALLTALKAVLQG